MSSLNISSQAHIASQSVILGDVTIGADSSVFYYAVVRGDEASITIGRRSNIQDNSTVHVDYGFPTVIGDDVTVGHNCVIHGCTIGDASLIGMGSTILNGAKIGKHCLIGAGSLVTQNTVIPDGMLVIGRPAKVNGHCPNSLGAFLYNPLPLPILFCSGDFRGYQAVRRGS